MEKYKYRAINQKGRPIQGVVSAASESDLYNQLQSGGLELVECTLVEDNARSFLSTLLRRIKLREIIQIFIHLEQMQSSGVPLLDALGDIRDTTDNNYLRDVMSEVHRDVSEGSSLTEAMSRHPKVFTKLYVSLVSSGEETGDLVSSYKHLVRYLKWVDTMEAKVRKAKRYPTLLFVVVLITVVVMMGYVVPQIVGFIENLDQEIPFYTTALIATSDFFVNFWWAIIGGVVVSYGLIKALCHFSDNFAYTFDRYVLKVPVLGDLTRKINIARFAQTFSALFASGVDVLRALDTSRETVTNLALQEALESVGGHVKAGNPLSQSFNASGEFPSMVVRMVKVGEDSGNLSNVLDQVSEFYNKDVDEEVDKIIAMIEPTLTILLGGMILWIAVGVFGPIYSSFENIDF